MKQRFIAIFFALLLVSQTGFSLNKLSIPVQFNTDIEEHGAFVVDDLIASPLLRNMYNLSFKDISSDLVKVCLNDGNQCRIIKHNTTVYLVTLNGRVKFDDSMN